MTVLSFRSSQDEPSALPLRRRATRGAEAAALRTAALVALLLLCVPAHADEIEPEPEPAPLAESEAKPEPAPPAESEAESAAQSEREPAAGSDHEDLPEPSWIPSIETGFETFDYNVKTTVRNLINPPSWQGTQHEAERQLMYRIGGELMGPEFENLPGRPRLFIKGGAQFQMFSSDKIFRDGDAFVDVQPQRAVNTYPGSGAGARDLPHDFEGQGSEISARFQDPSWYAGLGVAFSVPISSDLLLYLKPSVQYSVEEIDLPSGLTTVDEPVPMVDPDPCGSGAPNPCIRQFVIHKSRATDSTTDHSVGAGLEVALALFRSARPIRVSLYAEARFLWLVSDDTTDFADSNGVATYSVVRDDFNIKGGGGLRFSWVGFD